MSDTPNGVNFKPDDTRKLRQAIELLALRDADLAKRLSGDLRDVEKERQDLRRRLNRQLEREEKILRKTGLTVDEQGASLEKMRRLMIAEDKRIGSRLVRLDKSTQAAIKNYERDLVRATAKEQSERKKLLEEIRGSLAYTLSDATKASATKTFDTLLGPLKLITRPIEDLANVNFSEILGGIIEKRQDARKNKKRGRPDDLDDLDQGDLPKTGHRRSEKDPLIGPSTGPALGPSISVERVSLFARAVDLGTAGSSASGLFQPPGVAVPGLEEKEAKVIEELAPGNTSRPRRPELAHSGVIGRSAVYIGDILEGSKPEAEKSADKGLNLESALGAMLGKDAIEAALKKLGPTLLKSWLPALEETAAALLVSPAIITVLGAAALGITVSERTKRDTATADMLAKLPKPEQEALRAAGIDRDREAVALSPSAPGTKAEKVKIAKQLITLGSADRAGNATTADLDMAYSVLGLYTPGNRSMRGGMIFTPDLPEGISWLELGASQRKKLISDTYNASPEIMQDFKPKTKDWFGNQLTQEDIDQQAFNYFRDKVSKMSKFARGGIVPGPIGQPSLVQAEGGETFVPSHDPTFRKNLNIMLTPGALPGDREAARAVDRMAPVEIDGSFNDRVVAAIERLIDVVKRAPLAPAPAAPSSIDFDAYRLGAAR